MESIPIRHRRWVFEHRFSVHSRWTICGRWRNCFSDGVLLCKCKMDEIRPPSSPNHPPIPRMTHTMREYLLIKTTKIPQLILYIVNFYFVFSPFIISPHSRRLFDRSCLCRWFRFEVLVKSCLFLPQRSNEIKWRGGRRYFTGITERSNDPLMALNQPSCMSNKSLIFLQLCKFVWKSVYSSHQLTNI